MRRRSAIAHDAALHRIKGVQRPVRIVEATEVMAAVEQAVLTVSCGHVFQEAIHVEVVAMTPTVECTAPNAVRVVLPDVLAAARFIGVLIHLWVAPEV